MMNSADPAINTNATNQVTVTPNDSRSSARTSREATGALTARSRAILGGIALITSGAIGFALALFASPGDFPFAIKVVGGIWFGALLFYQIVLKEERERAIIRETIHRLRAAEERYRSDPSQVDYAWDLAQTKLELYINTNLDESEKLSRLIRLLTIVGAGLVVAGGIVAYLDPARISPAILTAAGGALSQLLGAVLTVGHRAYLSQSKDLIPVLERMMAVGMAIRVITESIPLNSDSAASLRNTIAEEIFSLYKHQHR